MNLVWNHITYTETNIVSNVEISVTEEKVQNTIDENVIEETEEFVNESIEISNEITILGTVIIPSFNVEAQVAEGTTKEIMDEYVGHFEETSLWDGNIGIAAHNRGYNVNYFANVKDLQIGDEIIYENGENTRRYIVEVITIIEDTDWSYLQATEDNRITLITCVENEPSYRRCVQAVEKI